MSLIFQSSYCRMHSSLSFPTRSVLSFVVMPCSYAVQFPKLSQALSFDPFQKMKIEA